VQGAIADVLNWFQHDTETKDSHWREAGAAVSTDHSPISLTFAP
jgi:hypothetical protein